MNSSGSVDQLTISKSKINQSILHSIKQCVCLWSQRGKTNTRKGNNYPVHVGVRPRWTSSLPARGTSPTQCQCRRWSPTRQRGMHTGPPTPCPDRWDPVARECSLPAVMPRVSGIHAWTSHWNKNQKIDRSDDPSALLSTNTTANYKNNF